MSHKYIFGIVDCSNEIGSGWSESSYGPRMRKVWTSVKTMES